MIFHFSEDIHTLLGLRYSFDVDRLKIEKQNPVKFLTLKLDSKYSD